MKSRHMPPPNPSDPIHPALKSGATGGAATGSGVEYQTLFTVYLGLDQISRLLRETPDRRPQLVVEPRVLGDNGLTRWDLQLDPGNVAWEAKEKPTKADLIELLKRARSAVEGGSQLRFELVYGECTIPCLAGIRKLLRLAEEAAGDESRFRKLCDLESDDVLHEVLNVLGDCSHAVGRRLSVKAFPAHAIDDAIAFQLRFLVPANQSAPLRNGLIVRFLRGMKKREVFFMHGLMGELNADGIEFSDPGSIIPTEIAPSLHRVIFLLQHCSHGLPTEILAAINPSEAIGSLRAKLESSPAVLEVGELWHINPLPGPIGHTNGPELLGAGLTAILEYIRANRQAEAGYIQVENAIGLVRKCSNTNPEAALTAFDPLDKLLKRRGRKRDVLEIATITVECARKARRTEATTRAEAKSLICGQSWVYQRIGQFDDANLCAEKSLELGKSIGWTRNTAFCLKCLGRMRRVRAEQSTNDRVRKRLLNESRELLEKAITEFSGSGESDADAEVGDCQSLLGRTQLLSGRMADAAKCASIARDLITNHGSKDYMDLLILEGELASLQFDYSEADKKFAEALDLLDPGDCEKSEIAARAYYARALNRWAWTHNQSQTVADLSAALHIWEESNDHFNVGLAQWTLLDVSGEIPKPVKLRLKGESPAVRVEAVRLFRTRTGAQSSKTLSQRADLNDLEWKRLLGDAKKNVAIRDVRW